MRKPLFDPKILGGILLPASLAVIVSLLSPPEKTLGNIAKFIYFHGALSWAAIATFTVAGILGAAFILRKKTGIFVWADAFVKTAVVLWSAHYIIGIVSMQVAWGGIFWQEPRFVAATLVLLVSLALYSTARIFSKPLLSAILFMATPVATWALLLNSGRVFHPANPIMGGQSLSIKLYAAAITALLMITSFSLAYGFRKRQLDHSKG